MANNRQRIDQLKRELSKYKKIKGNVFLKNKKYYIKSDVFGKKTFLRIPKKDVLNWIK